MPCQGSEKFEEWNEAQNESWKVPLIETNQEVQEVNQPLCTDECT